MMDCYDIYWFLFVVLYIRAMYTHSHILMLVFFCFFYRAVYLGHRGAIFVMDTILPYLSGVTSSWGIYLMFIAQSILAIEARYL